MNSEQVQQGRDALIALGWESESITAFAKVICEREVKLNIAQGILPYLTGLQKELAQVGGEITDLINHIEEFSA